MIYDVQICFQSEYTVFFTSESTENRAGSRTYVYFILQGQFLSRHTLKSINKLLNTVLYLNLFTFYLL